MPTQIWGHPRVGGGTRDAWQRRHAQPRAIPAWAGAPSSALGLRVFHKGHPRVGGGTRARYCSGVMLYGPSPRGRGHQCVIYSKRRFFRAIPAWAGAPRVRVRAGSGGRGHPRVGGGTGLIEWDHWTISGPSPRGRGHRVWGDDEKLLSRAIPAWAGAPRDDSTSKNLLAGHPRVGGGTSGEQQLDSIQLSKISRLDRKSVV